ncbi:16S rRNA (uracil(1498)-N(3))-methyltransferase [Clostridium sp. AF15-17LB]|nr:16S rRNA (uracil(1498)-N(3))-methyltransferase [Clostridium sp. AF15-17LB]
MHHFFVTPSQVRDGDIFVEGQDVNHLKNVLRVKPGEAVAVSDGDNRKYVCTVERYEEGAAVLRICEEQEADTELPSRICLFQGLPKQDKMELIVQKAVELGVSEVVPVVTRRSVVKLDEKKAGKKVQRWQSIAESASKQAGRGHIPKVAQVAGFKEALLQASGLDVLLIPYELAEDMRETKKVIGSIVPGQSVGVFIGPEGGFEREEVEAAIEAGARPITLGRRILRTETAGLTTLSVLMFHLEG